MAEVVDNYTVCNPPPLQRTLSVTTAGKVVLDIPPKISQPSESSDGGPYDSKENLQEVLQSQVGRSRFPRDLEDTLEASLAAVVRTTGMQLKVLGEVRHHMQRHKKLVAEASRSEEHRQALEGLQNAVESMRKAMSNFRQI
ncbi:hypothetical protein Adt_03687 [Abeliophyllum distichum]|uniref:Uncharacterized protein n=1 Tax=Abeliophyllum distichum TaxID=126358 RepID=A0ABD1VZ80_9LAMI